MYNTLLIILAIIFSIAITIMVIFGIYFIIACFQLARIRLDIQDLWNICSYAYCFMDEEHKSVFATKLKEELNLSIEETENNDNKIEIHRISRLKQIKKESIELYDELTKTIKKSVRLARIAADDEVSEIKNAIIILNDVLN